MAIMRLIKIIMAKRNIRMHAMSAEGCQKQIDDLKANIAWHEQKRRDAMRELAELEIPVTARSAFK